MLTSSCSSIVLFSYFTAIYKVPHLSPKLAYWPDIDTYVIFRVPYIKFSKYSTGNGNSNGLSQELNGHSHSHNMNNANEVSFKIA